MATHMATLMAIRMASRMTTHLASRLATIDDTHRDELIGCERSRLIKVDRVHLPSEGEAEWLGDEDAGT